MITSVRRHIFTNGYLVLAITLGLGLTLALLWVLSLSPTSPVHAAGPVEGPLAPLDLPLSDSDTGVLVADPPPGATAKWRAAVQEQLGIKSLDPTPAWTAVGENNNDYYGAALAAAGDVNGDGYSDVIVGANGYPNDDRWGRAYIYHGSSAGLGATPALTLTGEITGSRFGGSVATAGDVNGDGYADVVVGATSYLTDTGRAYIYLGSAEGLNPTPALTLTGENEGDRLGRLAATAGDVNGDGYADVIVPAFNYPSGTGQGKVYLHLGSAAGLDPTPAFTATGETGGDNFGIGVGTAGDVNGDGYADVIVGASNYGGTNNYGRIYIYYGSPTGMSATDLVTVTGTTYNERLGKAVSTAGDVNGDGYADIVIGADYYSGQAGRAYIYQGGPDGLDTTPIFAESDASPHFGRAVGTAGDINGDGYADIVVGTSTYPNFTTRRGRILVYLGSAAGPDGTPDFVRDGENAGDRFGDSVGTAGDVDGDGFSDLLVGAYGYPNGLGQGKAYIYTSAAGRQVLPRQLRGDGSGMPMQPWGLSYAPDGLLVRMNATSPMGRGYVKLHAEACPPGIPFGDAGCTTYTSPSWTDVTTATEGIVFTETLSGLAGDTVYRWRARVLQDSPFYPQSPWRRLFGQGLEADLRVGTPPDVAIAKTVTPNTVGPGQPVTYTLAFSNAGSLAATDVTIVDQIPAPLTDLTYWSSRLITPTGAFSYTWEVGDLVAGEGGVITVSGTVDPSATGLFDLVNQATISTTASDGNLGNNVSIVTSTVDAEPPVPPALLSPADGAVFTDTTPTLTWQPSTDAAGYWLDFNGTPMDLGDVTAYTTTALADGVYTWTVAAYDDVGNTSAYTDVWSFEVDTTPPAPPVLLSPADGAVFTDTTPTLTWQPSADAAGYWLDFNGTPMDLGDVTAYTTTALADGVYTWTVAAYDDVGNTSAYTDTWSFEVVDTVQPEVVATSPAHNAVGVGASATIVITFTKPINAATFDFSVMPPDPGGWVATWDGSGAVVTLTHNDFGYGQSVTATVAVADDLAGTPLRDAPYTWEFDIELIRVYLPLVLRGFP